ncbi:MAG: hypothetical protein CR997_09415 [Acidobacteria bacterium]|nr:MAG: hypothetical protein CR997_09415 [Acidobacteriota bacterium]
MISSLVLVLCSTSIVVQTKWDFHSLLNHAMENRAELKACDEQIQAVLWQGKEAQSHMLPRAEFNVAHRVLNEGRDLDLSASRIQTTVATTISNLSLEISGVPFDTGPIDLEVPLDVALPDAVHIQDNEFTSAGLKVVQPLYAGGQISLARQAARHMHTAKTLEKEEAILKVTSEVYRAYQSVNVLVQVRAFLKQAQSELSVFKSVIEIMADNADPMDDRGKWGLYFLELDDLNIELNIHLAEVETNMNEALAGLALAADIREGLSLNQIQVKELELNKLWQKEQLKAANNNQIKKIEQGQLAFKVLEKKEKAAYKPIVGLEAFYNYFNDSLGALPEKDCGVQLGMKMNLFSGGEIKARAAQYRSKAREYEHLSSVLANYLVVDSHQQIGQLKLLERQIRLAEKRVALLQERQDLALFGFKNNMADFKDYRDAFWQKCQAQAQIFQRKNNFVQQYSALIKRWGLPESK